MTPDEIAAALAEPFPADEVKWKPQSVKGNRALAICYIDARCVMDRLDAVLGVDGWQDEYLTLTDNNVLCRLSVRVGGAWVTKADVGGESEQPDGGDRCKAAHSDALKRAAVKFGVGRYLYSLGHQWVDYDPSKKQFASTPRLPAWAIPGAKQAPAKLTKAEMAQKVIAASPSPAPSVEERCRGFEARMVAAGEAMPGELMEHLDNKFGERWGPMSKWLEKDAAHVEMECKAFREHARGQRPASEFQLAEVAQLGEEKAMPWLSVLAELKLPRGTTPDKLSMGQAAAAIAFLKAFETIPDPKAAKKQARLPAAK